MKIVFDRENRKVWCSRITGNPQGLNDLEKPKLAGLKEVMHYLFKQFDILHF